MPARFPWSRVRICDLPRSCTRIFDYFLGAYQEVFHLLPADRSASLGPGLPFLSDMDLPDRASVYECITRGDDLIFSALFAAILMIARRTDSRSQPAFNAALNKPSTEGSSANMHASMYRVLDVSLAGRVFMAAFNSQLRRLSDPNWNMF